MEYNYKGTVTGRFTSKVSNLMEVEREPKGRSVVNTEEPKKVLILCDLASFDPLEPRVEYCKA
jgi:hypothetical protein